MRVLATSREGLGVERRADHGAAIARAARPETPSDAIEREIDAVRAVRRTGGAAARDFALTPDNVDAVAQICRRLDGIPLAIELAAARVRVMSPGEIAALLDERFRLLTGGRRTAVERHQTLRQAVDWSYDLLDEARARCC